jgi:hypothetical protein
MAALSGTDRIEARREGRRRLAALRLRVRRIRIRVACIAVVLFVALFGTIYVQMAQGVDPALNRAATSHSTATASAPSSSAAPTPVTTHQS